MSLLLLFKRVVQAIITPKSIAPETYPVDLPVHQTAIDLLAANLSIDLPVNTLSVDLKANTIAVDI